MIIEVKTKHLKENGPKAVIRSAFMDALKVHSKQVCMYSSFCFLKAYSGQILATVAFPENVLDFFSNYFNKSTHKPFKFRVGEVYLCEGYTTDILENYLKELDMSIGVRDDDKEEA